MEKAQKIRTLAILNFISLIAILTINALANILPINNKTTGELSDNIPNLFVPAGLTFSIWGLIYLLLTIFSITQFKVFKGDEAIGAEVEKIGPWFIISSIGNFAWILLWHYELVEVSLVAMLIILGSLMLMYTKLNVGKSDVERRIKWSIHIAVSVYFGWISVATIANVTAVLVVNNWDGWGISEPVWTLIVIAVGLILGIIQIIKRNDIAYAGVVVWAYLGIYIKRVLVTPFEPIVAYSALISAIVLVVLAVVINFISKIEKNK
jgi:hypothetical protein